MNNVRELRLRAGVKQTTLATVTGFSQSSISEWDKGKNSFSIDAAISMARYFHVSVGCVVGDEPIPEGFPNHLKTKPLQAGDPIPAYIGNRQLYYDPPFTVDQVKTIESIANDAARKAAMEAVRAIKEDTTLYQSQEKAT